MHLVTRRRARLDGEGRAVDQPSDRAESSVGGLLAATRAVEPTLPGVARAVVEDEPDEHLHVRIVLRDVQRLYGVVRLCPIRHTARIGRLRLVTVLGDPHRNTAMEERL